MTQINPYLTFDGKCQEAFEFYKTALGGELTMQTVEDSPMAKDMLAEAQKYILHASLSSGDIVLMGSDMLGPEKLAAGNTINLCLNATSEEEVKRFFDKLSVGGKVNHPLKEEFWGALYGDLVDKYGFRWMFNFDKNAK